MSYPQLQGLSPTIQIRLERCCDEMQILVLSHFPTLADLYGTELQDRIFMTMYLELIHMGFFKESKK